MDCSLPGSSIQGILKARVLEWGAIAFASLLIICLNNSVEGKYEPPCSSYSWGDISSFWQQGVPSTAASICDYDVGVETQVTDETHVLCEEIKTYSSIQEGHGDLKGICV